MNPSERFTVRDIGRGLSIILQDFEDRLLKLELEQVDKKLDKIVDDFNEAIEEHWPKNGDKYFYVTNTGKVERSTWMGETHDLARREAGNFYQTKPEAIIVQARVLKAYKS